MDLALGDLGLAGLLQSPPAPSHLSRLRNLYQHTLCSCRFAAQAISCFCAAWSTAGCFAWPLQRAGVASYWAHMSRHLEYGSPRVREGHNHRVERERSLKRLKKYGRDGFSAG